ncbi:biodegradative arginine decarboxylase [Escherichia coli]|nr:biodegradative arginine decarboxylase [Escherichia coli]
MTTMVKTCSAPTWGIERTSLGSLLDHTGAFGESEKYAARVFGADRSWSVVVGTSGSNRTIHAGLHDR